MDKETTVQNMSGDLCTTKIAFQQLDKITLFSTLLYTLGNTQWGISIFINIELNYDRLGGKRDILLVNCQQIHEQKGTSYIAFSTGYLAIANRWASHQKPITATQHIIIYHHSPLYYIHG